MRAPVQVPKLALPHEAADAKLDAATEQGIKAANMHAKPAPKPAPKSAPSRPKPAAQGAHLAQVALWAPTRAHPELVAGESEPEAVAPKPASKLRAARSPSPTRARSSSPTRKPAGKGAKGAKGKKGKAAAPPRPKPAGPVKPFTVRFTSRQSGAESQPTAVYTESCEPLALRLLRTVLSRHAALPKLRLRTGGVGGGAAAAVAGQAEGGQRGQAVHLGAHEERQGHAGHSVTARCASRASLS